MTHVQSSYTLQVVGIAWAGNSALYTYTIDGHAAQEIVTLGEDAANKHAPDFQAVTDCRVVQLTSEFENASGGLYRCTDTYRTLRGFRHGMTPRKFHRRVNGY